MKLITILSAVVCIVLLYSFTRKKSAHLALNANQGIHFFTGSWQEALELAKKENKLIFLDAYATWCGPCKKMKRSTFTNKKVAAFYNEHFVNLAVDMEKGEGIVLSQKYVVTAYPTLLFLKPDGTLITRRVGFHNASEFLQIGQEMTNLK